VLIPLQAVGGQWSSSLHACPYCPAPACLAHVWSVPGPAEGGPDGRSMRAISPSIFFSPRLDSCPRSKCSPSSLHVEVDTTPIGLLPSILLLFPASRPLAPRVTTVPSVRPPISRPGALPSTATFNPCPGVSRLFTSPTPRPTDPEIPYSQGSSDLPPNFAASIVAHHPRLNPRRGRHSHLPTSVAKTSTRGLNRASYFQVRAFSALPPIPEMPLAHTTSLQNPLETTSPMSS
jgi:hypothetical protein